MFLSGKNQRVLFLSWEWSPWYIKQKVKKACTKLSLWVGGSDHSFHDTWHTYLKTHFRMVWFRCSYFWQIYTFANRASCLNTLYCVTFTLCIEIHVEKNVFTKSSQFEWGLSVLPLILSLSLSVCLSLFLSVSRCCIFYWLAADNWFMLSNYRCLIFSLEWIWNVVSLLHFHLPKVHVFPYSIIRLWNYMYREFFLQTCCTTQPENLSLFYLFI